MWHIQFNQRVELELQTTYVVKFKAKADTLRIIPFNVVKPREPYETYFDKTVTLSDSWQEFVFEFSLTSGADKVVNLSFELGKLPRGSIVYFDYVKGREEMIFKIFLQLSSNKTLCCNLLRLYFIN